MSFTDSPSATYVPALNNSCWHKLAEEVMKRDEMVIYSWFIMADWKGLTFQAGFAARPYINRNKGPSLADLSLSGARWKRTLAAELV
jgi:hypothetical protein